MNATNSPQSPAQATASAQPVVRDYLVERVALLASNGMPDEVTLNSVNLMREHGLLGFYSAAYYREVCTGLTVEQASMMYAEHMATSAQRLERRKQLLDRLSAGRGQLTHWVDEIPTRQPFANRQHAEQIVFSDNHGFTVAVRIAQNLGERLPFTVTPVIADHKRLQIHPITEESQSFGTVDQVVQKVQELKREALKG